MEKETAEVNYPEIGRTYKHYKGGKYVVLFLSKHTTTNEVLVNCRSVQFGSYHSRPLSEWFDVIGSSSDAEKVCRFTLING